MTMPTPQTMLYKAPGPHQFAEGDFDYIVVDDDKIEETLAQGWFLTTGEAQAAREAKRSPAPTDTAPPTRAELEQKAKELGIEFDGRTSDKKLGERIAEKLRA